MGVVRSSDQRAQDDRFNATEKTLDSIKVQMAEKASKDELNRVVARFERDIDGLRQDTKVGFSEIRGDIKDLRNDIIDLLKKGP